MTELAWTDAAVRILVATLLGSLLGLERERDGQDAGFRTHLLVALGSALFGLISVAGFDDVTGEGAPANVRVDASRVAAYVPAGIGFIGGGAIVKYAGSVKGITTASSLWAAAAIGLGAGLGFWVPAAMTTGVGLVALTALKPVSAWLRRRSARRADTLVVVVDPGAPIGELIDRLGSQVPEYRHIEVGLGTSDNTEVRIRFWRTLEARTALAAMSALREWPGVIDVGIEG